MRLILNSVNEKNDRFFLNPIVDRPFTKLRCSKVSLPNTVDVAHPDEDLRFTTTHGATTQNYTITLQNLNYSDAAFWATYLNNELRQRSISDWIFRYDTLRGQLAVEFVGNGTDKITFTKECRIFGITKGEVITHTTYNGGVLQIEQEIAMSWPSVSTFIVEVYDANGVRQFFIEGNDFGNTGKNPIKTTATEIVNILNANFLNIPSSTSGPSWPVTWAVVAAGDTMNYTMSWAAPPPGLSGDYEVAYYFGNINGYAETSETGLSTLRSLQNTTGGGGSFSKTGTVAYNFTSPLRQFPAMMSVYQKTLTIPPTEQTSAQMVSLFNNVGIHGLTASAGPTANQFTISYTPRTVATATDYITGNVNIWPDATVAGFTQNSTLSLSSSPAPSTLVITLPQASRPDNFITNVVNLVPYNHAYITCSISTEDCDASVGNDAVIAEVPHAGSFMERHNYENNSDYFLPITQKDALSSIEIGIIDDRGRDLKSRLRGAPYLVVLELE